MDNNKRLQPPVLALRFLRFFCDQKLIEDVEGDLTELYQQRALNHPFRAKCLFTLDVLLLFRPGIIRDLSLRNNFIPSIMLYHYVKNTVRHALKSKSHTLINLSGLVIGLTASILMMLWIQDEYMVDKFHEKSDRTYQVWRNMIQATGDVISNRFNPQPLEDVLRTEYPEVDNVTAVSWQMEEVFRKANETAYENGIHASPGFFQIFTFPFVSGDPTTALNEVNSVVISEKMAKHFFGSQWTEAVGQLLEVGDKRMFTVTGVVKDIGANSTIHFDWVIPEKEFIQRNRWVESWYNGGCQIFFTLKDNEDIPVVSTRAEQEINKHTKGADERLYIQKFSDIYLHGTFQNGVPVSGRIVYVRILTVVALFTLLVACINFMNLASANASIRSKEIGVRKVMGAKRGSLRTQFFTESSLHAVISASLSVLIVGLILPYFNLLTGKNLTLPFDHLWFVVAILCTIVLTALASGSYPALLLSAFQPIHALKGKANGNSGARFREVLTVFQFVISMFLICGTLVVSSQIDFVLHTDVGINKENVVMVVMEGDLWQKNDIYRSALLQSPDIKSVTFTNGNPLAQSSSTSSVVWEGKHPDDVAEVNVLNTDAGLAEGLGIAMVSGRGFSDNLAVDSIHFLVNEVLAAMMGFQNPIGQKMSCWGKEGTVIGVVKNFHMASMYEPIAPLIVRYDPANTRIAMIRTQGSTQRAIAQIERTTKKLNQALPFRYQFMDVEYGKYYESEMVVNKLLNVFAVVCIFISCLGLFGLSSFAADQRAKEIGVRKVMGAGVTQVILLLTRGYAWLMLIAFIISVPLSYYFLNRWLDTFAFRTALRPGFFAIAGLVAFLVGGLTVGFKSYRAAVENPIKTLKEE